MRKEETIDKTREKASAQRKPSTLNPGTSDETIKIKTAFITKVKSPNVKSVKGRERRIRTGLTKVFKTPRTIATIIAVKKVLM